ncbi:MAG: hypothetical protein DHS20C05_02110 [Hyphococcus sp.]|nr:MAG: hypothetical protein DHS20C05_02110 [Marinicaulis sp.]
MKRGRNQRRRPGGGNPNRALDSNGPEVRIRGTANQIYDKYVALARDASSSGDRIKAESYLQHAEHYFRVIRATQPAPQPNQQASGEGNEQPSVDNGEDRNGDGGNNDRNNSRQNDRNQDRNRRGRNRDDNGARNEARQNNTDASEPTEKPKAAEQASPEPSSSSSPEPSTSSDDAVAEEKPKRKRAPRKSVKRVAKEDKDAEPSDATTAAE